VFALCNVGFNFVGGISGRLAFRLLRRPGSYAGCCYLLYCLLYCCLPAAYLLCWKCFVLCTLVLDFGDGTLVSDFDGTLVVW